MVLSVDGDRVVFCCHAYARNDGSDYGSPMRLQLYAWDLLKDGFERVLVGGWGGSIER